MAHRVDRSIRLPRTYRVDNLHQRMVDMVEARVSLSMGEYFGCAGSWTSRKSILSADLDDL